MNLVLGGRARCSARSPRISDSADPSDAALAEAQAIHERGCGAPAGRSASYGAELIPDGATVLTHCNAGAPGHRRLRHRPGRDLRGAASRARTSASSPTRRDRCLQGARLTAWELHAATASRSP